MKMFQLIWLSHEIVLVVWLAIRFSRHRASWPTAAHLWICASIIAQTVIAYQELGPTDALGRVLTPLQAQLIGALTWMQFLLPVSICVNALKQSKVEVVE
jgi:P2-related tail formation protein